MNRIELYDAISSIGIVLHECNKEDNPPFDDSTRKYWLELEELRSLYNGELTDIYTVAIQTIPQEQIDHHETDLYIMVTEQSKKLIRNYRFRRNTEKFISAIAPHVLWFDIPFAYTPEWKNLLGGA